MMLKPLIALFLSLFATMPVFAGQLGNLSPDQLLDMQQKNQALVVDVRTPAEWQSTGIIADSYKLQAFENDGSFDAKAWVAKLEKLKTSPGQPIILVCRSGSRSSKVGEVLTEKLGMTQVYHLANGLQFWFNSGRTLSPNCLTVSCK